jgi:hypothetical protein
LAKPVQFRVILEVSEWHGKLLILWADPVSVTLPWEGEAVSREVAV